MTFSKPMRFRLGLALAATLSSFTALAAGGPSVSFNSPGLVLTTTPVGGSVSSTPDQMIVNSTSSPAVISAITLTGANANEFGMSGGASAPCAVGTVIQRSGSPGNFCALHFTFNPTSVGAKSATATVSFGNGSVATLPMFGTSVVATPVMDFFASPNPSPNVAVGATGTPFIALYVGNNGGQALSINGITVAGANPADFAFTHVAAKFFDCTAPSLLPPSATPGGFACQIGVAFRPSALGARSATLTLATNDPARPVVTVQLAGNGVVAPPPPPPAPVASTVYVTDLWWNPSEPAWSLNIVHHKQLVVGGPGSDALVATWNTFDANLAPTWVTLTSGSWTSGQTFTGVLHQTTGPYFGNPYLPGQAVDSVVGSATLTFSDANNGTLVYTLFGVTSSRAIVRKPF
jgi:hypothetical protein